MSEWFRCTSRSMAAPRPQPGSREERILLYDVLPPFISPGPQGCSSSRSGWIFPPQSDIMETTAKRYPEIFLPGDFCHTLEDSLFQSECSAMSAPLTTQPWLHSDPWCIATKKKKIRYLKCHQISQLIDVTYKIFSMFSFLHPLPTSYFC